MNFKRIAAYLLVFSLASIFLSACIVDDTDNVVASIDVNPHSFEEKVIQNNPDKTLTVTVLLKKGNSTKDLNIGESFVFIKDSTVQSKIKGIPVVGISPVVSDNKIVFTIAYSWLNGLEKGEHTVGVTLKFKKSTVTENPSNMGIFKIS